MSSMLGNGLPTSGLHNTVTVDCSGVSGVLSLDIKLLQTHAQFEVSVTATIEVSVFYVTNVLDQHSASILKLEQKATLSSRRRNGR
jgi:hypothetical protein